jgi:DNA-binding LacI/PurR family transcriptional regulator
MAQSAERACLDPDQGAVGQFGLTAAKVRAPARQTAGSWPDKPARPGTRFAERRVRRIIYAPVGHQQVNLPPELTDTDPVLVNSFDAGRRLSSFVPDETGGGRLATQTLRRHPDLSLLFCATDRMAMGAYEYLKETGHRIWDGEPYNWPSARPPEPPRGRKPCPAA